MGDGQQASKPFRYVTSHPGQPGHPSVGRRNKYQRKLGRKQAPCMMHIMHKFRAYGLAV